jgi:hypothetical protein
MALLAVAGVVALASGGHAVSSAQPERASARPPGLALIGGVPLQQARCVQWQQGTTGERRQVVAALAHVVGGPTPYGNGSTLAAADATALFDRACAGQIAQHWLLYEMYIRAAGLSSYANR